MRKHVNPLLIQRRNFFWGMEILLPSHAWTQRGQTWTTTSRSGDRSRGKTLWKGNDSEHSCRLPVKPDRLELKVAGKFGALDFGGGSWIGSVGVKKGYVVCPYEVWGNFPYNGTGIEPIMSCQLIRVDKWRDAIKLCHVARSCNTGRAPPLHNLHTPTWFLFFIFLFLILFLIFVFLLSFLFSNTFSEKTSH